MSSFYDLNKTPRNILNQAIVRAIISENDGALFDPSDLSTLYQDAAGTIPVTEVEQPVGLMLDKSQGLMLGPELAGGLSVGVPISVGGYAAITLTTSPVALLANSKYKYTIKVSQYTSGNLVLLVGGTQQSIYPNAATTYTFYAATTATNQIIQINSGASNFVGTIESVSVKELYGNHATQSITASRPTLSARKNLLVATETLSTQSVTTLAAKYCLSFWGTGSITLSGTSTGVLQGTGAGNRVWVEFTPTAGTLTLTVAGTVSKAQLELTS